MNYGLYMHLPFCASKCPYCSFTSTADSQHLIPAYLDALRRELDMRLGNDPFTGDPGTVYIGGGTPSLVPAAGIAGILADISVPDTAEITVEANPESMTHEWLDGIRSTGANRLSIGVQSFDDTVLAQLGRIHDADAARRAIDSARKAGFENISVDLIYGVPGQTMAIWRETIETMIDCSPEHVSCYALSIEEDTGYFRRFSDRPELLPPDDAPADMYDLMREMLGAAGYEWYEISNLAKPGRECRHNMHYWDFTPYLGVGVSAHSFDGWERFWNIGSHDAYIHRVLEDIDPVAESEEIDADRKRFEYIMLALRTHGGMRTDRLSLIPRAADELETYVRRMIKQEYLVRNGNVLVLTPRGAMLSDEICADIIAITQLP